MKRRKSGNTGPEAAAPPYQASSGYNAFMAGQVAPGGAIQLPDYTWGNDTITSGAFGSISGLWDSGTTTKPYTHVFNFPQMTLPEHPMELVAALSDPKATLDWQMDVSPDVKGILSEPDPETRKVLHGLACGHEPRELEMRVDGLPVEIREFMLSKKYHYCTECRAIF